MKEMWKGKITEELKEVAAEYAKKHNGMYPHEYDDICYDEMPYEYFLAKIKEANKKNCSIVDLMK